MSSKEIVIDYADSYMAAGSALKDVYNKMLVQNYDGALEAAYVAIVEVKMMMNAIRHAKDATAGENNA